MDWTQFWSGIIGAVLGSITTGFFTIWVAKMNMKENVKSRNEERKFFFHTNRPEFEVIDSTKITTYEDMLRSLEVVEVTKENASVIAPLHKDIQNLDKYNYGKSLITEKDAKYKTVYSKGSASTESRAGNYSANSSKYGDAIYEISSNGESSPKGWNSSNTYFMYVSNPFLTQGGYGEAGGRSSMFTFESAGGHPGYWYGFRVCLTP